MNERPPIEELLDLGKRLQCARPLCGETDLGSEIINWIGENGKQLCEYVLALEQWLDAIFKAKVQNAFDDRITDLGCRLLESEAKIIHMQAYYEETLAPIRAAFGSKKTADGVLGSAVEMLLKEFKQLKYDYHMRGELVDTLRQELIKAQIEYWKIRARNTSGDPHPGAP